jgi:hypothetical protein
VVVVRVVQRKVAEERMQVVVQTQLSLVVEFQPVLQLVVVVELMDLTRALMVDQGAVEVPMRQRVETELKVKETTEVLA